MITFSNISLQPHGILARSRANSALGALTLRKDALTRIDTPTGYFGAGRMHYYVKDYQGNIRQVTDADGNVEQDNHYYPYGMLMAESSDILAAALSNSNKDANPYLYGSKEYLTTGTANLLDFTARTYDPSTILFQTQDPMSGDYTPFLPYLYCASDPINRIDPTGCSTWVTAQSDGRYKIVSGDLEDEDLNIYVVTGEEGKYEKTGEIIGVTPVITSFYNSDAGEWATESFIDPNDNSGIEFISNMTGINTPGLMDYIFNARTDHIYDFKASNGTVSNADDNRDMYRGMPMGTSNTGDTIYASARDIGNIVAGYVAGFRGLIWAVTRLGFDLYQSWDSKKFTKEGISSQNAQAYGFHLGLKDCNIFNYIFSYLTK